MWCDISSGTDGMVRSAVCLFSKDLCKSCGQYRGRHYDLCGSRNDGGILEGLEDQHGTPPVIGATSVVKTVGDDLFDAIRLSPTRLVLDDIFERSGE